MRLFPELFAWSHYGGYECSSKGDKRFSALYAKMPDGRTIEHWYQCDVKGYDVGGENWRLGKGKPSLLLYPEGEQYNLYKSLWKFWAIHNMDSIQDLRVKAREYDNILSDGFATSEINQARALSEILNEWKDDDTT